MDLLPWIEEFSTGPSWDENSCSLTRSLLLSNIFDMPKIKFVIDF